MMLIGHSSSVAAAICQHQDAHEHAVARESRDALVAAVPLAEEAAAADSKKTSQSPGTTIHWPTDLLPAALPPVPLRVIEPIRLRPTSPPRLASTTIIPLLQPPSA